MKWLSKIVALLRLPVDVLLLTFHYVKGTCWLVSVGIKRRLGLKPKSWPFGCFSQKTPNGQCACIPGRKYGNVFLFRAFCPDSVRGRNAPACETFCTEKLQTTRRRWRPPLGRILGVGLFLIIIWTALGYGLYHVLPATQTMKKAKTQDLLHQGNRFFSDGKYEKARIVYQKAIKVEPKNAAAYLALGGCLVRLNRTQEGFNALIRAVELNSQLWEGYLELAKMTNRPGSYEIARSNAEKVIQINPENKEGYLILASSLLRQDRNDEAISVIDKLLEFEDLNTRNYYEIGELYSLIPDLEAMETCMKKALELNPDNLDAHAGLAYTLIKRKQWDQATLHLDKILTENPENLKALVGRAEIMAEKTEIQAAINEYDKILQLHPANPNIAVRLAGLLIQTNVTEKGIDLLRKVVEAYPQHLGANLVLLETYYKHERYRLAIEHATRLLDIPDADYYHVRRLLGRSYISTKQFGLAINTLRDVVEKFPEDFDANVSLAYAYHYNGETDQAIECYQQAAKLEPESKLPNQFLGILYGQHGQIDEAIANYRQALKKAPDDRAIANNLAMNLIERGKQEDIEEAYQLTLRIHQKYDKNAIITDTMGWVLYHRGDFVQAKEMFNRAIELDAYLPDPYYHLGKLHLKQKKFKLAAKKFRQALKLSNSFPGAKDAKELLASIQAE